MNLVAPLPVVYRPAPEPCSWWFDQVRGAVPEPTHKVHLDFRSTVTESEAEAAVRRFLFDANQRTVRPGALRGVFTHDYGPEARRPHEHGLIALAPSIDVDALEDLWPWGRCLVEPLDEDAADNMRQYIARKLETGRNWYSLDSKSLNLFAAASVLDAEPAGVDAVSDRLLDRYGSTLPPGPVLKALRRLVLEGPARQVGDDFAIKPEWAEWAAGALAELPQRRPDSARSAPATPPPPQLARARQERASWRHAATVDALSTLLETMPGVLTRTGALALGPKGLYRRARLLGYGLTYRTFQHHLRALRRANLVARVRARRTWLWMPVGQCDDGDIGGQVAQALYRSVPASTAQKCDSGFS